MRPNKLANLIDDLIERLSCIDRHKFPCIGFFQIQSFPFIFQQFDGNLLLPRIQDFCWSVQHDGQTGPRIKISQEPIVNSIGQTMFALITGCRTSVKQKVPVI